MDSFILERFLLVRKLVLTFPTRLSGSWKRYNLDPTKSGNISQSFDQTQHSHNVNFGRNKNSNESYLNPKPTNLRYNPRHYEGGLLPRIDFSDEPVRMPKYNPKDMWAPHRACFGQNDYIDILGDGSIKPRDFYTGPLWVLGARNEYQRVSARLNNPAIVAWLEEFEPGRLQSELKRQRFLFKRVNKRRNIAFAHYRDSP